jgi:hypothetical protein
VVRKGGEERSLVTMTIGKGFFSDYVAEVMAWTRLREEVKEVLWTMRSGKKVF